MTPKEKTVDIFYKYFEATKNHYIAKECALIAIEEILDEIQPFELGYEYEVKIKFWNNVKKEIEAL